MCYLNIGSVIHDCSLNQLTLHHCVRENEKTMSRHIKQNVITQNHPMACMASSTYYQFSYPHASLWHVEIHQSILGIRDCPPCLPQGTWALGHSHDHAKNGLVQHPLLIFLRYVQVLQWSRQPRRMHDHPTSWSIRLWPCSCTRPRKLII